MLWRLEFATHSPTTTAFCLGVPRMRYQRIKQGDPKPSACRISAPLSVPAEC